MAAKRFAPFTIFYSDSVHVHGKLLRVSLRNNILRAFCQFYPSPDDISMQKQTVFNAISD